MMGVAVATTMRDTRPCMTILLILYLPGFTKITSDLSGTLLFGVPLGVPLDSPSCLAG